MTTERTDWRAEWVERHLKKTLTPFQRECVELICDAMRCGPYDFARTFERAIWSFGKGVRFIIKEGIAEYRKGREPVPDESPWRDLRG